MVLLDQLLLEEKLTWVGTCNEMNAGYAADGYARVRGAAACAVTFTVGGLSILNAIAGSYSEDLPVICITGDSFSPCIHPVYPAYASPTQCGPLGEMSNRQPSCDPLWRAHAGGPNSNDSSTNRILHHTIGLQDREQELRCFKEVTCDQVANVPGPKYSVHVR